MMGRIRWGWLTVIGVPLAFITYFFLFPVGRILWMGLSGLGSGTVGTGLLDVAWFTVWQAALSTILTLIVAAPMTWAVSNYRFRGRRLALALVTVPFVLPTVVVATAFVSLGWRDSIGAILAAHVFFNVAVVVRTVSTLWTRIDPALLEAAASLGADPRQVFWRVTLPLLRSAIAAAAAIVFLFTFTSFGVVLILGGLGLPTLEVEIYRQAVTLFDLPLASMLALAQIVGVGLILLLYNRYQASSSVSWAVKDAASLPDAKGRTRRLVLFSVWGTLAALAIPMTVLVARSIDGGSYARLFMDDRVVGTPAVSVVNSLGYAVVATLLATFIGLLAANVIVLGRGRLSSWFDAVLMLPLGTSAVTVGFGFIVALGWPVDLRASVWLVPIAHALVAIPLVLRTTVPTMRAIGPEMRESAAALGAPPFSVWRRVDLPLSKRAVLTGAAFAFVVSLGEFGATSFVARPAAPTIPTMIYRLLGRPGQMNFGMAMALSVLLGAMTAAVILWIDRAAETDLGAF